MELRQLVKEARSFRRYDQSKRLDEKQLLDVIDIARLTPSAANRQPLKYRIVFEKTECEKVFSTLSWAGALHDWSGPEEGEKPAAYILILLDTEISKHAWVDPGIVGVTMQYAATQMGFGGCMLGAVDKAALSELLEIPGRYVLQLVVALGVPAEQVVLETAEEDTTYFRDADGTHHVPKRTLDDLILK
jgi:nitroreductase